MSTSAERASPRAHGLWPGALRRRAWPLAFAGLCLLVVVRNLAGLDASPPGAYVDEASIGYNAWAIAHHGVDEHGASWPLFFRAFGEYKNPVYIYALVPFVRVLGASVAVVRLPAALFGLVAVAMLTLTAWHISRSRWVALATLAIAALTPWLTQESRLGFEVISEVALLSAALWCISRGQEPHHRRYLFAGGVLLALTIFAYSTGRLEVLLLTGAAVACLVRSRRSAVDHVFLVLPVIAGYAVLGGWMLLHPGALTARFALISITGDGAGPLTVVARFLANYVQYLGYPFLFLHGDPNIRHSTGFEGMLMISTLTLLVAGVVVAVRRRSGMALFCLAGALLGPVAAALTNDGTPHSLRDATALPFLVVLMAYGLAALAPLITTRRGWALAFAVALVIEGGGYTIDMYASYPARAGTAFDAQGHAALMQALPLARGHTLWLGDLGRGEPDFNDLETIFVGLPDPPSADAGDASTALEMRELGAIDAGSSDASKLPVRSGDVLVLDAGQAPPGGAQRVADFAATYPYLTLNGPVPAAYNVVTIWRIP